MALKMKAECEKCRQKLLPENPTVYICSFECTYCKECSIHLGHICPNCQGELVPRPPRKMQSEAIPDILA